MKLRVYEIAPFSTARARQRREEPHFRQQLKMEMDKEKLFSEDGDKNSPDTGSEIPPSHSGSSAYQTPAVITEPESYPATTPTPMSELPPPYLDSSDAISQPKETTQHTRVAVVTSQPSRHTHSFTRISEPGSDMLGFSVFCCIICCLCGSPLTLICFVPAIILLSKVK